MKQYRIQAIPFNRTFSAEEQDKYLGSKLNEELSGISGRRFIELKVLPI